MTSHLRVEFFTALAEPPQLAASGARQKLMQRSACGIVVEAIDSKVWWCNQLLGQSVPTCETCAIWYDRVIELGVDPFAWESSVIDAWRTEQPTAATSSRPK